LDETVYFYGEALKAAPNDEYRAFTIKQLALLLTDVGRTEKATPLLKATLGHDISKEGKTEIKHALCHAWMQELVVPYDQNLLKNLKDNLWEVLQVYEKQERIVDVALLLTDAGIIANYSESWAESLGYFNRAVRIFEDEQLPELAANAQYRKGILLFTWAKKDNPQFFRSAAECFQKAAQVFSRTTSPEVYADIQHHLGMIYAEIPDEAKKKGIWAAVSSSAFKEALGIYTKKDYPYEYATVCNHYGNALTKYPEAKLSDNYEKALYYYQEALSIRTAEKYPMERCLTILNYLEAQWNLNMAEDELEEYRFEDMVQKAEEVISLSQDEQLINDAQSHLKKLAELKAAYA
jgi:tetratricopeptide (TPR) repeat protein